MEEVVKSELEKWDSDGSPMVVRSPIYCVVVSGSYLLSGLQTSEINL